ncbi:hypothetical protein GV792_17505 [Nocardia cyriacigeorgica]|uniref:hypothetical protein n=1 Tax=Nocardia cyriacigeorgica TaxID=135487 RepID=UPI0013BB7135|nr:hypothetical protein [Nocardia cyriacigeorgica]NEW51838.1 hypothetical protein [Nocardia cyriacigeorgica]
MSTTAPPATTATPLLAELRELADTAPARAAHACWSYLRTASDENDRDLLSALFSRGAVPNLDGDYDGIVAGKLFGLSIAALANPVLAVEPGWVGKSFNAETGIGHNRMNRNAYLALRALLPRYRAWQRSGAVFNGVRFEHRTELAAIAPFNQVVAVTYTAPELGNPIGPLFPMDRVRDEIVELVPGVCLGRALLTLRSGEPRVIGYFAMRTPQHEVQL